MNIEYIVPRELTFEETKRLLLGVKDCAWDKSLSLETMVKAAMHTSGQHQVYFYRISGEANGIVICETDYENQSLFIKLGVGTGMVKHMSEVREQLAKVAKGFGLSHISGYVSRPGLMATYAKYTRAKPVATLYVEDL